MACLTGGTVVGGTVVGGTVVGGTVVGGTVVGGIVVGGTVVGGTVVGGTVVGGTVVGGTVVGGTVVAWVVAGASVAAVVAGAVVAAVVLGSVVGGCVTGSLSIAGFSGSKGCSVGLAVARSVTATWPPTIWGGRLGLGSVIGWLWQLLNKNSPAAKKARSRAADLCFIPISSRSDSPVFWPWRTAKPQKTACEPMSIYYSVVKSRFLCIIHPVLRKICDISSFSQGLHPKPAPAPAQTSLAWAFLPKKAFSAGVRALEAP